MFGPLDIGMEHIDVAYASAVTKFGKRYELAG